MSPIHAPVAALELPEALRAVPIEDRGDQTAMYDPITECEFRVMEVGPELASLWLEKYNSANRTQRERVISGYAYDMSHDQWWFTGDPVRFGTDGLLYDGQHRLEAIDESGKPQRLLVIRGLKPEARVAIDGGAVRKITDDLKLEGYSSTSLTTLTAIATRALYWELGYKLPNSAQRNLSRTQKAAYIRAHPELEQAVRRGQQIFKATSKKLSPSVSGFAFMLAMQVDDRAAYEFFEMLEGAAAYKAGMKPLPNGSPVLALLRRIKDLRLPDGDQLYLLLRAWVLFRSDRPTDRLQLPRNRMAGKPMTAEMIPDPGIVLKKLPEGVFDSEY